MFSRSLKVSVLALSVAAISFSSGCFKKAEPVAEVAPVSAVVGTWMAAVEGNGVASTLTFNEDGSFVIDTDGAEGPEVTGKYTATDAQVTLTTESAPTEECAADATYSFTVENGTAKFAPAETDACAVRAEVLGQSFSKH
jgi:hypothetical protein